MQKIKHVFDVFYVDFGIEPVDRQTSKISYDSMHSSARNGSARFVYRSSSGFGFGIWDFGNRGFGIWDLDLGFSGLQFSLISFYLHAFAGTEYVSLQETGSRPRQGPQSFEGIL